MSPWERWKKVSINNKLMIYMTAILAVATTLYTLMYRSQVNFMKENATQTAEQTNRIVNASERLASTTKDTLEEAKRVNKETSDRADRTLKAIETQANASMSQANTSQVSARASEKSAVFAQQAYASSQQAKVFFKRVAWHARPEANKRFDAEFVLSNSGATAYEVITQMGLEVRDLPFEGVLPCDNSVTETEETPLEPGAEQTLYTSFRPVFTETGIKALENETAQVFIYGSVVWRDSLGRRSKLPYCRMYNKLMYPLLMYCPKTIIIPDCSKR